MAIEPPRPAVSIRRGGAVVGGCAGGTEGERSGGGVWRHWRKHRSWAHRGVGESGCPPHRSQCGDGSADTSPRVHGVHSTTGFRRYSTSRATKTGNAQGRPRWIRGVAMASLSADAPSGEGGEVVTKLKFDKKSYSAEALEAAVVAHGATVTEISLG